MTRSDDEEVWDGITSEINRVAKCLDKIMAKAIRRAEEGRIEMQASIANLHQCINTLGESCRSKAQKPAVHKTAGRRLVIQEMMSWGYPPKNIHVL